jgi:DNA primase
MSVAEEIKSRLDIVNYVQQYAPLKKAGRLYKACCPFHHEKTPSFVVDPERQTWRCFGACATGGDVLSFAMRQHSWTFSEALRELGQQVGVETRQSTPEQRENTQRLDRLRGLLGSAAEIFHNNLVSRGEGVETLRYAREKRAFQDATIERFKIGYALAGWQNLLDELTQLGYSADDLVAAGLVIRNDEGRLYDRFRNRLMIPIRDDRGRVVGFGARALAAADNPKYMNSPQSEVFDKSRLLFGLDTAKRAIRDSKTAVIVEGYMDAIQAQQNGFENVVAQMGTALTETQLKLIAPRFASRIILALDADAAGQNATMRSLEVARQALQSDLAGRLSVDIRILQIPGAKDPDDFIRESPEAWQELVDAAVPVAEYVIDIETAHLTAHASVQERQEVALRVLPILTATENDLYQQDNLQRLAMRLRVAERDLLAWAQEEREKAAARAPARRKPDPRAVESVEPEPPDMPPLDVDALAPPDDLETAPAKPVRMRMVPRDSALEAYCLRMLYAQPELLYGINRKLRELARGREQLENGPLCEFSIDDFTGTDLRILMDVLKAAMTQDELTLEDFVTRAIEPALLNVLQLMMRDETEHIRERMNHRFEAEMETTWKAVQRRAPVVTDPQREFIDKALRLRLERLQRERVELQYLQGDNTSEESRFAVQVNALARAKHLIEEELQSQNRNFL